MHILTEADPPPSALITLQLVNKLKVGGGSDMCDSNVTGRDGQRTWLAVSWRIAGPYSPAWRQLSANLIVYSPDVTTSEYFSRFRCGIQKWRIEANTSSLSCNLYKIIH